MDKQINWGRVHRYTAKNDGGRFAVITLADGSELAVYPHLDSHRYIWTRRQNITREQAAALVRGDT